MGRFRMHRVKASAKELQARLERKKKQEEGRARAAETRRANRVAVDDAGPSSSDGNPSVTTEPSSSKMMNTTITLEDGHDFDEDLQVESSSNGSQKELSNGPVKQDGPKNHPSTPMNTKPPVVNRNTHTITRKTRTRQQTVTVESQSSKDVDEAFEEVQKIPDLSDPVEELRRRMQRLFCEKEKEYTSKLSDIERNRDEDLALTKMRFAVAMKTINATKELLKYYKPPSQQQKDGPAQNAQTVLSPINTGGGTRQANTDRLIPPDVYTEVVKERNHLRDELRELENSYSDLFKRYEKMRENCVLLKNSEEALKKNLEDEAIRYDKLAAIYAELRQTAAIEFNKANEEVIRLQNQHDENTLSLRCRLKRFETEINSLQLTIQGKNIEIEQLKELNDELMRKTSALDDEDGVSMADSYEEYASTLQ